MAASRKGETMPLRPGFDVDRFNRFGKDFLPGFVGLLITEVSEGLLKGELELRKALLAPNGYLHAGAVVSFADTLAGRSEEHTSELQSLAYLVCRLLLEKKNRLKMSLLLAGA